MAYPVQTVATAVQSLGGGYTSVADGYAWLGIRPGRTYRFTLANYAGGGTLNYGASYNGGGCNLSCDAWYTGPTHDFAAPASSYSLHIAGKTNGAALGFQNYTVQDVTDAGDGVTVTQAVRSANSATCTFAAAQAGALLVLHLWSQTVTDVMGAVPAGWTAATSRKVAGGAPGFSVVSRTFYKWAAGGETSVTVTDTTAAFTHMLVREYAPGPRVASSMQLLGTYQVANQVAMAWGPTTPPAGTELMVFGACCSDASSRRVTDGTNANPYPVDYCDAMANQAGSQGYGAHKAAPSGAQSGELQPLGGSSFAVVEVLYFGSLSNSFPGEPGGGVW